MIKKILLSGVFSLLFCLPGMSISEIQAQSLTGNSGLFHVPTAEMLPDRTIMVGLNQMPRQYSFYGRGLHDIRYAFINIQFLPRVELMFRYTYLLGLDRSDPTTGPFMDRMVAGRLLIMREGDRWPALLLGVHDPGEAFDLAANKNFGANYLVASKGYELNQFKTGLHIGYAFEIFGETTQTFDGVFGGISVSHSRIQWLKLMTEYDSFRWNIAGKARIAGRVQLMAGLMEMKRPAGGISYRVIL